MKNSSVTYWRGELLPYSGRQMFLHVVGDERYDVKIWDAIGADQTKN